MQLNPHLHFNGECEAAFKSYEKNIGAKITFMMTNEGSPIADQAPAGWGKKILHATLAVGDQVVMGMDAPPDRYQKPQGFHVSIGLTDTAEADRIFQALAENGTVTMTLQETFWAARFGMLTDQFGIPWMINCGKTA